jgi:quercetin dioxygenase-like cupin family protein
MLDTASHNNNPGAARAYVLREGEGHTLLVAGQTIRVLAGTDETAGGFGAVVCEATYDRQPIPMHFHEREHDTWLCTRGRLQIWSDGRSRILTDGDFAYVKPHGVHSYRSVAPRTSFFGVVAPGGWEGFFSAAGEEWTEPGLPEANRPFDFSRMGPAMGKYRIMRVPDAVYVDADNGDATDRALPDAPASYVLQAGYGDRRRLNGHLSTLLLSRRLSDGALDMRSIEAGRGAAMPAIRHGQTHVFLYLVSGALTLTVDGEAHALNAGDCANIPAGVAYQTEVTGGHARWVLSAAHGDGLELWDRLGEASPDYVHSNHGDPAGCREALLGLQDIDVALA